MYLSRLILNPRNRGVLRELAEPYEMHRTLMKAFPKGQSHEERDAEDAVGLLYRIDREHDTIGVLVQSRAAPEWGWLAEQTDSRGCSYLARPVESKLINVEVAADQVLTFRLRANPTKRLSADKGSTGKRVGLYTEEEQLGWLQRKGGQHGFRVLQSQVRSDGKIKNGNAIRRDDGVHDLELLSVQFDGVLQVADPDLLIRAVEKGIGSAKGFGFGLLSLAPAHA